MLPKSVHAALKFYTPLAGAVQSAKDQLSLYQASQKENDLRRACYEMVFFHWWLRQAVTQIGGYYFKSRDAETLADLLYQKHRILFGIDDEAVARAMGKTTDFIRPATTLDGFLTEMARPGSSAGVLWTHFEGWAKSSECARDLPVLDAYGALLIYEANRPSEHWYGSLDPIRFTMPEAADAICEWSSWKASLGLTDELVASFERIGKAYLAEVKKGIPAKA